MYLKKALLAFALLCCATLAKAQDDRLSYSFNYGKSAVTDTRFTQNDLKLRLPLGEKRKSHFFIGTELGILKVQNSSTVADSASLKSIGIIVGYQWILKSGNRLTASAEPLFASDMTAFAGNEWRFKGDVLYNMATSDHFALGFGMVYQYQFSGSQILPVVIPIFRFSDKVTLSGAFPIAPRLEIKLDQQWSIGAGINGGYSSYRLSAFNNQYMMLQNWSFGFTPKYRFGKSFELSSFLGFGNRTLSIYNADQKIPLRIYSLAIGGGSYTPTLQEKFKGASVNFTLAYRFDKM